jgi:hypothetical protein
MFSHKLPWDGLPDATVCTKVIQAAFPGSRSDCSSHPSVHMSDEAWCLLESCWKIDTSHRPSLPHIRDIILILKMFHNLSTISGDNDSQSHGPSDSSIQALREVESVPTLFSPLPPASGRIASVRHGHAAQAGREYGRPSPYSLRPRRVQPTGPTSLHPATRLPTSTLRHLGESLTPLSPLRPPAEGRMHRSPPTRQDLAKYTDFIHGLKMTFMKTKPKGSWGRSLYLITLIGGRLMTQFLAMNLKTHDMSHESRQEFTQTLTRLLYQSAVLDSKIPVFYHYCQDSLQLMEEFKRVLGVVRASCQFLSAFSTLINRGIS